MTDPKIFEMADKLSKLTPEEAKELIKLMEEIINGKA